MKRLRSLLSVAWLGFICLFAGGPAGGHPVVVPPDAPCPLGCALPTPAVVAVPLAPAPVVPVLVEPVDPPTPVVKLKVRVPACGLPGQPIEYRICVENCSPADAHHVIVKNPLPANAKFVRASPEPNATEPELQWRLGTLAAGRCKDIVLILQPTNKEDVNNCTRVHFEHGQCVTTRFVGAPPVEMPPAKEFPEKEPPIKDKDKVKEKEKDKEKEPAELAKLVVTIDGPKKQYMNLPTRYFITVKNTGKADATNVLVDFELADKTKFEAASDNGKFQLGKIAWLLGTLAPGAERTVVATLRAQAIGELCHTATALADRGVKAQAQFCTMFAGVSALLLEMVDRDDPIPVGGDTSYPIVIRNTGNAPVTNLRLRAIIPDNLILTRAKAPVNHQLGERVAGGQTLVFDPIPQLSPDDKVELEVFVRGAKPGDVRFQIEMRADQLESGPVIEQESTRVFSENGVPGIPLSRVKSQPVPYRP